jgi:tetratricopeptide (TPR) repeat protein
MLVLRHYDGDGDVMFGSRHSFILLLLLGTLSGCSARMHSPDSLSHNASTTAAKSQQSAAAKPDPASCSTTSSGSIFAGGSPEMAAETEVSEKSLQAWRLALKGDEKRSMALLNDLDRKYPKMKTVAFMKGQVLERLGKKKEAIAYYQAAVTGNDFDLMKTYKLAEAMRTAGDIKSAIPVYRGLLTSAPEFVPAHLGLAKSLLTQDKNSPEAKRELEKVVSDDPTSKDAKDAQGLLDKLNAGPGADKK